MQMYARRQLLRIVCYFKFDLSGQCIFLWASSVVAPDASAPTLYLP